MATFREVPEIRGDSAPLYLQNDSHTKKVNGKQTVLIVRLRYNAQIRRGLKGKAAARAP